MRSVLNICLNGPYTDGFSYQDNLLPKYQKRAGWDVVVLANTSYWDRDGSLKTTDEGEYLTEDGVKVIRISPDKNKTVTYRFKRYSKLWDEISGVNPDVIFLHGCQSFGSATVAKYVRMNPNTVLFVDNHADASNSGTNFLSKYFLHRVIWRNCARKLLPYTYKFWGTLPARIDFLAENYGIPRSKCDLLTMGGDDDQIDRAISPANIQDVRSRYGYCDDDFLIVTGGKIDSAKRQTLDLMQAAKNIGKLHPKIRLIVFGPVCEELKDDFYSLVDGFGIKYIPWADENLSYDLFASANLAVFPGRHSVYWEQAASCGLPLVVKYWDGTNHINVNGNATFLYDASVDDIEKTVEKIFVDKCEYNQMKERALSSMSNFRYSFIASKSLDF